MIQKQITAVVPIYNTPENFLRACVESMLAQSYKNSQILLVDDGSDEETHRLCNELAQSDSRVEVIHQENAGPSIARNTGLKNVKGDYLTFVDSDDTLQPDTWKKVIAEMEASEADCAVFGWINNESGQPLPKKVSEEKCVMRAEDVLCRIAADNDACGGGYPWNKVWRVDTIRSSNDGMIPLFDEKLFIYEDKEWILRVLHGLRTVVLLPDVFYDYRFVSTSLTNAAASWERRQYNAYEAYDQILEYLSNESQAAWRGAVNFYFYFCATALYNQCRHPSWYGGWQRCRRTKKSLYKLCRKISMKDLDSYKKKLLWLLMQIWGLI